ncbi:MAG TPA: four helix bundle protein [Lutibacter sp.]|nr:four helix bundle protein [Lutibacter sp.]
MKKFDLEERLINFSMMIIDIVNNTPNNKAGGYLAGQLIKSGISPALNYAEAQSAESRKDFVHKMKISLKELRESFVNMKIMHKAKLFKNEELIISTIKENNELISIFVSSVKTAQQNMNKK